MIKKIEPVKIAVIGGSGISEISGIENVLEIDIETPFGKPSASITIGTLDGVRVAFLPRHGKGHVILPSEINVRANIYALKSIGVEQIIALTAVGSLQENIKPKDFVIPEQVFDRTKNRINTFFGNGIVAHIGFADPFCNDLRDIIHKSVTELAIEHHFSGTTYVCIDGPQFSTRAESKVNRENGFSIVGMTAIPESKLAREAEICYANISLVTDYDVWKIGEEVGVEKVLEVMAANANTCKKLIKHIIPKLAQREIKCECHNALKFAVQSSQETVKQSPAYASLSLFLDKYFSK
ncbi:MAG: S-methyl-5'-thioadenosine phosphorylase [Endomicrobiaceae bacterium]|nr:S-methyl-5'-thioadenosine phosphorylase [Endomicrobiaceae bacterium]MDD3053191.1 S-methyl-5'-thioadenosine phosphorylase [Endomicrobiaceae bacterium]MDD3922036.1 S-methyl-5'-thioadenosine phosphorylase [Endomicrobiaceae bacterium]MDD5102556.1 S-methyl-5'-thioadenosine phosphorylase [Endomicrobiaceae bacterium]